MSETLSSLIAFVGFLIVFSMLVQSVQEALKNLFKLKAGVWERFFINLYNMEFKKESKPNKKLVAQSFWRRVSGGQFVGEFDNRLQGIKSIVVKSDVILKEVKETLQAIAVASPAAGQEICTMVAIVEDNLKKIAGLKLDTLLTLFDESKEGALRGLLFEANIVQSDLTAAVSSPVREIKEKALRLLGIIKQLETNIVEYRLQIENKADAWLAQINGEYKKNMLWWTVVISFLSVVLLNADSFEIYKYFTIDAKAQSLMVEQATKATAVVQRSNAMDLNAIDRAIKAADYATARKAMVDLSEKLMADFTAYGVTEQSTKTKALSEEISPTPTDTANGIQALKTQYGSLSAFYMDLQKISIDYQLTGIASTGLPLGWVADGKELKDALIATINKGLKSKEALRFLFLVVKKASGLLLTVFLISFGAPFWKNVLNSLVSIKTMSQQAGQKK